MKRFFSVFLAIVVLTVLTACGGASTSPAGETDAYYGPYDSMEYKNDNETTSPQSTDHSKMIFRANIDLETMEYDEALESIDKLVSGCSGYYEEQELATYSSGYRYARMVIRIPSEQFDSFCHQVGNVCHTIRINTTQENVSERYYDIESRLNTARTKLARLQELLSRAETMADIITIENEIADTEQTIDSLTGSLRGYDNLIEYSTVRIDLDEVYRYTGTGEAPLTLGQRLGEAFASGLSSIGDFFENLLVFLAYAWFWILLAVIAVVVLVRLARGKKIFRRRKKAAQDANAGQKAE